MIIFHEDLKYAIILFECNVSNTSNCVLTVAKIICFCTVYKCVYNPVLFRSKVLDIFVDIIIIYVHVHMNGFNKTVP